VKLFKQIFLTNFLLYLLLGVIAFFLIGFTVDLFFSLGKLLLFVLLFAITLDILLLFSKANSIEANRDLADKLSNGDENEIIISLENNYRFKTSLRIIDELPAQLQIRHQEFSFHLRPREVKNLKYYVRPVKRGDYHFGAVNVFAKSPLRLLERKYSFNKDQVALVYPSFIQMRKYELLAISHKLQDQGIKKIRRIGQNQEFEQIKEYVVGDDFRTLNWKATARANKLMVNNYQDEKSQQVYSIINKGRVMQMPFEGMTLLDYAINSALAISNIALKKDDRPGLITFQHKIGTILPATKRAGQIRYFMDTLYHEKTAFKESDYSRLYNLVKNKVNKRSLLLLYTNFESLSSMRLQLAYLKRLAADHLLVCILFENTELQNIIDNPSKSLNDIYSKTIAQKIGYEKKLIVKELNQFGIKSVLTKPQNLTINTINAYLEIKARGLL